MDLLNGNSGRGLAKVPADLQRLWDRLAVELHPILHGRGFSGPVSWLMPPRQVDDDTTKLLISTDQGRPGAVLICARPGASDLVARSVAMAAGAKAALGGQLGKVILTPIAAGQIAGSEYVLLPWCRPLSDSTLGWVTQRSILNRHVMRWLGQATAATVQPPGPQCTAAFLLALRCVADHGHLGAAIRQAASRAIERIETGQWIPRHILAHNDLWKGNILLEPSAWGFSALTGRFVIIDWVGAETAGYPLYDLIRLAQSLKVGRRALGGQVRLHCAILQCQWEDAGGCLAAALGNLGLHLENFSQERYVKLADACWQTLASIGGT